MNKLILMFALVSPFANVTSCFAVNDAIWTGFKYSVAIKYLGIDETTVDMPQPKTLQMPEYPILAMRAAASGSVQISFLVTQNGSVEGINVEKASAPEFGKASERAVLQWKFIPGVLLKNRAQAAAAHMRCMIEFQAKEAD